MINKQEKWQAVVSVFKQAAHDRHLERVLEVLFTYEERAQLAARVALLNELLKGEKTQRQMAQDLEVSIAKITRGSNNLKELDEEFKEYFKAILNKA